MWTHKEVDLALHPVVDLVLEVGDAEKFSQALGLDSLNPFLRVSKQGPCFTGIEEDGGEKRLVQLELSEQEICLEGRIRFSEVLSDRCRYRCVDLCF